MSRGWLIIGLLCLAAGGIIPSQAQDTTVAKQIAAKYAALLHMPVVSCDASHIEVYVRNPTRYAPDENSYHKINLFKQAKNQVIGLRAVRWYTVSQPPESEWRGRRQEYWQDTWIKQTNLWRLKGSVALVEQVFEDKIKAQSCKANMQDLARGMRWFAEDNFGRFDLTMGRRTLPGLKLPLGYYNKDKSRCPSDTATVSYAVNENLNGVARKAVKDSANTVAVYEGKNGHLNFRHEGHACVAFVDGSIKLLSMDEAKSLRWKPSIDPMMQRRANESKRAWEDNNRRYVRQLWDQHRQESQQREASHKSQVAVGKKYSYHGLWTGRFGGQLEVKKDGKVVFYWNQTGRRGDPLPMPGVWSIKGNQLLLTHKGDNKAVLQRYGSDVDVWRFTPHNGGVKMRVELSRSSRREFVDMAIFTRQWSD